MEETTYSSISHATVIDLGSATCKLQLIISLPTNIPLSLFSHPEARQSVSNDICYHCGYLKQALWEHGLYLKEVEVTVPPIAEYLDLEERLRGTMDTVGYKDFILTKGVILSIPQSAAEKKTFSKNVDWHLRRFKEGNSNFN